MECETSRQISSTAPPALITGNFGIPAWRPGLLASGPSGLDFLVERVMLAFW